MFLAQYGHSGHIDKLLKSDDRWVRATAAKNPAATKEHLNTATHDSRENVQNAALENPNIATTHLTNALKSGDYRKANSVMKNPNATAKHITTAFNKKFPSDVHQAASYHKNTTPEHIEHALSHDDPDVRNSCVEFNPNISKERLLRVGRSDPDDMVRETALDRVKGMK